MKLLDGEKQGKRLVDYSPDGYEASMFGIVTNNPLRDPGWHDIFQCHAAPKMISMCLPPEIQAAKWSGPFQEVAADLVLLGHTHIHTDQTITDRRFVNPGSVGHPDLAERQGSTRFGRTNKSLRRVTLAKRDLELQPRSHSLVDRLTIDGGYSPNNLDNQSFFDGCDLSLHTGGDI